MNKPEPINCLDLKELAYSPGCAQSTLDSRRGAGRRLLVLTPQILVQVDSFRAVAGSEVRTSQLTCRLADLW